MKSIYSLPFQVAFYRSLSNYIQAIEPIHDITESYSLVDQLDQLLRLQ